MFGQYEFVIKITVRERGDQLLKSLGHTEMTESLKLTLLNLNFAMNFPVSTKHEQTRTCNNLFQQTERLMIRNSHEKHDHYRTRSEHHERRGACQLRPDRLSST